MDDKSSVRPSFSESNTASKTTLHGDASTVSVHGHGKEKSKKDGIQDAAERRRIWSMAAASAAAMITELTQKRPPQFDDVTKVFAPISPAEWAAKRKHIEELRELLPEGDDITDAQIADELFYDPDATDDDLGMFLGPSDADLKEMYRGSAGHLYKAKPRASSKPDVGARRSVQMKEAEKEADKPRRSSGKEEAQEDARSSMDRQRSSMGVAIAENQQDSQVESTQNLPDDENQGDAANTMKKTSVVSVPSAGNNSADEFYAYEEQEKDEVEGQNETSEESEMEMYLPADVNINVDEALVGLEGLLDDLRLESRITDRFKYKLINKYGLLLQALITYQERETEVITNLKTKKKILNALHQFVKTEAELAAKAVVAEEDKEEEKEENQMLDLIGKHEGAPAGGGGDKQKDAHKENQGLSIEEMPAATIRETLLQQKNRLDVLECIKKVHVLQLKQLEFERTLLNLHYQRMVKPSDLSKEIKDNRRQVNDLQLEISSIHQEMGQVQNEIRIQEKLVIEEEKHVERLELESLTKQGEVQMLANKPVHVSKEADREANKLEQLQDVHDDLCLRFMDAMDVFRADQAKVDILATELKALAKAEAKLIQQTKAANRDYDVLFLQLGALSSREQVMIDKANALSERILQLNKQKKKIVDEQHHTYNEANKFLLDSQKLERVIKMATDAYLNARLAYDKMRAAFDAAKNNDQNSSWEKLSRMLQREIITLKQALDKKLDEAEYKAEMVARLQERLNALYDEQVATGKELQDLIRFTLRIRRECNEKSEQCIKLETQIQRVVLDKKTREISINDCLRAEKLIFKQLSKMTKKFNTLKTEKSAVINELSNGRQQLTAMKLKVDDFDNKLNAYLTQTQLFESMIKEKYFIILNARIKRDSIKHDAMRSRTKFRFHRNQKRELLLNTKTLRRECDKQKEESIVIRQKFEKFTKQADELAVNVRIRTEEICTFHEYVYCYQKILLKGSEEITVREMEMSKLNSLFEETRKHVLIVEVNQPDESAYFNKIEKLREKFYQVTDQRRDLEKKLNEDDNPARVREIDFEKLKEKENVEVLEKRLDLREENLATRDVIGLERTLMENHLTRITEDSLDQALHLKDFYGEQVKAIVNIRKSLNNVSQQIDGFICENSIASAQADIAEKHHIHCKSILAEAERRWAEGLAPTQEMEDEWKRLQWRKGQLKKACENSKRAGFLRRVKPLNGSQIQASKWSPNRRGLEDPSSSVLGWRFSSVSDPTGFAVDAKCQRPMVPMCLPKHSRPSVRGTRRDIR